MKKSDLKDFMVVESAGGSLRVVMGNRLIGKKGCLTLDMFDDELKSEENYTVITINKVYEINKEECICIDGLLNVDNLKLIWQREKEIDWAKVPRWIKVQVKDYPEDPWYNAYFIRLDDSLKDFPYKATFCDTFTLIENSICGYRQCRIHPEQEVKEEWYK
ncbi:hypothetical protein [Clostridium perfringens]|uniref:Uncharacterized protein n=1 Tax=Clostridium perfringens TaxID=1502 RepID=A0AAP4AC84_CLOPF|nr:hypothetical protein [Clostridium perfringens]MDH2337335.1 hypothetical protein [Clostridium perfringens]